MNDVFVARAEVERCPPAREEAYAVLVERKGMTGTGDRRGDRTSPLRKLS